MAFAWRRKWAASSSADVASGVALAPLTPLAQPVGNSPTFPQFSGRAKPGLIAVLPNGRRFVDEAKSYHVFGRALIDAWSGKPGAHAWLICDDASYRRYGLGFAKPWPVPAGQYRRRGYLVQRADARSARRQVRHRCRRAERNRRRVQRGRRSQRRSRIRPWIDAVTSARWAMPSARRIPVVAPLLKAPFHAVRVIPGAVGTFAGLLTDGKARVLDDTGQPIPGLYAAGNDLMSVFGGDYVGGGCTIGPAMTFGYLAALDAVDEKTSMKKLRLALVVLVASPVIAAPVLAESNWSNYGQIDRRDALQRSAADRHFQRRATGARVVHGSQHQSYEHHAARDRRRDLRRRGLQHRACLRCRVGKAALAL